MKPESELKRIIRQLVGVLVLIQSIGLFHVACFLLIFVPFLGGMAMIYGAGNASDEKIKQTWLYIGLMVVAPFILTILLFISSIQLLKNRRPVFVLVSCVLFVGAYLFLAHQVMERDWTKFTFYAALPVLAPIAGIGVSIRSLMVGSINNESQHK